ncbi:MAG: TIGR00153 family protein [Thermodesulfovibrionales bacterium]|nr:TIGR00153 family protein [Thermodesulfovibrionales bacterium]
MFDKILSFGKSENIVIKNIKSHINLLCSASNCFKDALNKLEPEKASCVIELERDADTIRRDIISTIHEGAFLPYVRPNLCRFVEMVDETFDTLEDAALLFRQIDKSIFKTIEHECLKIASINAEMCELLQIAFETLHGKGNIKEKNLAIRLCEKQVDDIKFELIDKLIRIDVKNFWEGKIVSDFVESITRISDLIEDASDYLYIIEISLK